MSTSNALDLRDANNANSRDVCGRVGLSSNPFQSDYISARSGTTRIPTSDPTAVNF